MERPYANAPAHCAPSIRKNFLTARNSIAHNLRVFWSSRLGIFIWLGLSLPHDLLSIFVTDME